MKKFILIFAMIVSMSVVFGQATATLRLEMPATPPAVGEQFLVGVWLDALDWPADPTIWSALYAWEFDPAVVTPVESGVPFHRYYYNANQMFADYTVGIQGNYPAPPGDLRVFFATAQSYGLDPSAYGFVSGVTPFHLFDLKFQYLGGDIAINWGTTVKLVQADGQQSGEAGGKLAKAMTEMYAPPPPAVGIPYELTLINIPPGGGANTWTNGTGDGMWFTDGNWSLGHVPTGTEDVDIPNLGKAAPVVIMGDALVGGALNVAAGAELDVDPVSSLTTTGLFTNDGMFVIQSEGGAGYGGSFIDMAGVAGAGSFEYDRIILCTGTLAGQNDPLGWHYLASPFDGFTTDMIPDYFVNAWDQPTGMWMQYMMDPIAFPCTPWPTTGLGALDAWSVNMDLGYPDPACPLSPAGTGAQVEFMSGAAGVHTGAYSKPLGYGAAGYEMWNMVSNPYPSGLDVNTIAWGPNTMQATYYYDGCGGNYVYWATGMGPYVMAPNLGFFVETTGADAFAVDNSNRAIAADIFWKGDVPNLLTLQATGSDNKSDKLWVRFADNVTAGLDLNGDAHKLFAETEGMPQIYTVAGTEKLAINALPATNMVPMGFTANGSGTYTIEAIETSDFANVVLEDMENGVQTDLLTSSYSFDYTTGVHNFRIHFTPLGTIDNAAGNITISAENHNIYVNVPGSVRGDIAVYNMMGQEVVRVDMNPGLNTIPMHDVNTYYIVKVISDAAAKTGKVFIR